MTSTRNGILAAGSFIADSVKIIDDWPQPEMLANIMAESPGNGGGAYNILKNLSLLGAAYPREAAGLLGADANGRWIRHDCEAAGIGCEQLRSTSDASTSYTDVMCETRTGRRTFFHQRGANALLGDAHIDLEASGAKIFFLAYLLLLDTLDRLDGDGRTEASRTLERARALGFVTAVDTVSSPSPDFHAIIGAAIQHTDYFICNEIEAGLITGHTVSPAASELRKAAHKIGELACPGRVIIHSAKGAVCLEPDGNIIEQPALNVPTDWIKGAAGAGDGFATGVMHGVHENAETATCLLQGVCVAAATLSDPSCSAGVRPLAECLALAARFGVQRF